MRSRAWLLGAVAAVLAACGGGGGDGGGVTPPPATVTISGRVTYDRVPFSTTLGDGLNYTATFQSPVRQATVELLAALSGGTGSVLATTITDTNGAYSVTVSSNTNVILRVKAESRIEAASGASWSLSVYNNTNSNALYVLDSSTFNTGTSSRTLDLRATSGWQGFSGQYDAATRTAAPFAILDTAYEAVQFVLAEGDATVDFPPLGLYWSPDNRSSDIFSPSSGNIGTTSYRPPGSSGSFPSGIYVLGQQNVDTDEFDAHVIAHEFQHYVEDKLGRTDTIGGPHSLQEKLDMRLAFSEGNSNAFAAMVLNDPQYRDSFGSQQGFDAGFSLESDPHGNRGWFSEASVGLVIWDAYDADNETGDTATIGFAPMWRVFRGELSGGPALTSIFPFITALKLEPGVPAAALDALVEAQEMVGSTMDIYATTETHDGGSSDNLPVYWTLSLNGPVVQVCGDADLGTYNLLGNRRFLRFSLAGARNVAIRAVYVAQPGDPGLPIPDPDLVIYRSGFLDASESEVPYEELYRGSLGPGDYVVEVYEYSHTDDSFGVRPRTCMNISLTG